jgi:hypothetical protein
MPISQLETVVGGPLGLPALPLDGQQIGCSLCDSLEFVVCRDRSRSVH